MNIRNPEIKTHAKIRMDVTLEVIVDGSWGGECMVDQVYRQGCESAINKVKRMISTSKSGKNISIKNIQLGTIYLNEDKD